ncbi:MAG: class I SAM-dependent methyltransferase [Deltaproteobacteria bacterium]
MTKHPKKNTNKTIVLSSGQEKNVEQRLLDDLKHSAVPDKELLANLGLYATSRSVARLLFFYEIYRKILHSHGVVIEFGVRWGQTLSWLVSLRSMLEPFNRHRKILGFDTFEGFRGVASQDGRTHGCREGDYAVCRDYAAHLDELLRLQEQLNPMAHIKRFELIKGDATKSVPQYFRRHPETMVSLAIFDFDIYKPTRAALKAVKPHLMKGSILVFDELCDDIFPGETVALREVFDLNKIHVQRLPMTSRLSFLEIK